MAITASQLVAKVAVEGDADAKAKLKAVGDTQEATSQKMNTGLLASIKNTAGGLLDFGAKIGGAIIGVKGIADAAIGFGSALISPNAEMEQTTVAFETLLGKGKQTQDFLQQMKDFAAATPFEFPEVATAAQHMLAFGFQSKQVIPILTNIGDAMSSMGKSSDSVDHIVQVFGQMHAAGKLNAGDMMQLASEGIPAWQFLADAMHKTIPEVQKLSSEGLIPADTAIKAVSDGMHKMFGGGMAAQAQTFNGLMSTLQDNAGAAMRAFTGPLFEAAKAGLTTLGNLVSSKQFQDFATQTGKQIADLFGIIGPMLGDVGKSFQSLQPILSNVGQFFQLFYQQVINDEPIGLLIGAFANLGITIGNLIGPLLQVAGAFLKAFGIDLTKPQAAVDGIISAISTFSSVMQTVANVSATVATNLQNFATWLNTGGLAADAFRAILIGVGVAFAAIQIGSFLATIPALVTGFIAWATTAGAAAIATIAATWPLLAIGAAIALVVAGIILAVQHWGEITTFLQGVWASFSSWFMTTLGQIGAFFTGIWNGIVSFFTGIWTSITGQAQAGGQALTSWWTGLWNGILAGLQAAWAFLVAAAQVGAQLLLMAIIGPIIAIANGFIWLYNHNYYFKAMIDAIVQSVQAGITWLQQAWQTTIQFIVAQWQALIAQATAVWTALSSAISSATSAVASALQSAWNAVASALQSTWNALSSAATSVWTAISNAVMTQVRAAVAALQAQWTTATTWLQTQWNKFTTMAQAAWKAVSTVFSSIWTTYIASPMQNLWNQLSNWFNNLKNQAVTWGSNVVKGIVSGIQSQIAAAGQAASQIASQIASNLGFHSPPPEGPASDSDTWMPNMIDMMASGLRAGVPQIAGATQAIAGNLNPIGGGGVLPSGTSAIPASVANSPTIIVNVPPSIVEMDGQRLTSVLMPYIVEAVRREAAGRF